MNYPDGIKPEAEYYPQEPGELASLPEDTLRRLRDRYADSEEEDEKALVAEIDRTLSKK